jgi:hypothetical protein
MSLANPETSRYLIAAARELADILGLSLEEVEDVS